VTGPALALLHNGQRFSLGERMLSIGRLPECDVLLDGWEVSRRHARIHPTPAGPVLLDRSRFGTFVNNHQVVGPLLLAAGDVLRIGANQLTVERVPAIAAPATSPATRSGLSSWWRRYGVSETGGAVAALIGALAARALGTGTPATALAAFLAEAAWFYLSLGYRDLRYEVREHRAAGRPFDRRAVAVVLQNLVREFGAAEAVDLLLRPICFAIGLSLFGTVGGVLAGKLVADLLFYGPVLATWHWRLVRPGRGPTDPDRLRRTTAATMPMRHLAQEQLREEERAAEAPPPPPSIGTER
jgi:hypothetical protein